MDTALIEKIKQEYQNPEYKEKEKRITELYNQFNCKYTPQILQSLSGSELLDRMFMGKGDKENLCYFLEKDPECRKMLGSIQGGSSEKFGLYYNKNSFTWKDSQRHSLNEDEAVSLGEQIRDKLLLMCKYVDELIPFNSEQGYRQLGEKIGEKLPIWQLKYLHFVYPKLFPTWYSAAIQRSVLELCGEYFSENQFERIEKLVKMANDCGLSNAIFAGVAH